MPTRLFSTWNFQVGGIKDKAYRRLVFNHAICAWQIIWKFTNHTRTTTHRRYENRCWPTMTCAEAAFSRSLFLHDRCWFLDLPSQVAATISSKQDAAGRSFCSILRSISAYFILMSVGLFNLTVEFSQVWACFALFKRKTSVHRAILISKRAKPTPVGNCRILCKM